jgi:hypothetical protein
MEDSFFIHVHVNLIYNGPTCCSNSSIITNCIYYPVHFQKVPNGPIIECVETFIHDHPNAHRHRRTHVRADTQPLSLSLSLCLSLAHSPSRLNVWSSFESQNISYYKYMHTYYRACACKPFFECHLWILKHWILKILRQGWRKFLHSNVVNIKAVADFRW